MSLFSGFSGSFIAGGLGEFNKIQEQKKIAEYEADKQVRQSILDQEKTEREMVVDLVKLQTEKEFEQQVKRDEFNAQNRRAYEDFNAQIAMYGVQGLVFGRDYTGYVDKDNNVQIEMYDPKLRENIVGLTVVQADAQVKAFTDANAEAIESQGLIVTQERVPLRKVDGVQTFTQGLSLKPLPSGFKTLADALAAIDKLYEDENIKNVYVLNPKLIDADTYGIESSIKKPEPKTFDQMLAGISKVSKEYTDAEGNELYDVFVAGKPGEHYYDFKLKIPKAFQNETEAMDYIKSVESKSNNLKGLFSVKDGQYDISFVEASAKLFETQEEAQTAADTASKDNPNYVYAVIGSNSTGWSIKADKKDKDKPDPSKDPSRYDQKNQAVYNFPYLMKKLVEDFETPVSGRNLTVIPFTPKIDSLIFDPGPEMANVNKDDYMAFEMPVLKMDEVGIRREIFLFSKTMPTKKVERLFAPDSENDIPKKLRDAGQAKFLDIFGTFMGALQASTKVVTKETVSYEIPANIVELANKYGKIDPRIRKQAEAVMEDYNNAQQRLQTNVIVGSETSTTTGQDGGVIITSTEYPNLSASTYVDSDGRLDSSLQATVTKYAIAGGMVSATNRVKDAKVLSMFNNATDVNDYGGDNAIEDAITSVDNITEMLSRQQFQEKGMDGVPRFTIPQSNANLINALEIYLSPFMLTVGNEVKADHTSRITAIQIAIPNSAATTSRTIRKDTSSDKLLYAVTGYESKGDVRLDLDTVNTGLSQAREVVQLIDAGAEPGLVGEVRRLKSAATYLFNNVLKPFAETDYGDGGQTRSIIAEEIRNFQELDLTEITGTDKATDQLRQRQKNSLLKYVITNLVYIQAKINDPRGRLSEGDREQAAVALANYASTAEPSTLKATAKYLIEQAEYKQAYLNAIQGPRKQVLAAEYYNKNYMAGRTKTIVELLADRKKPSSEESSSSGSEAGNTESLLDDAAGVSGGSEEVVVNGGTDI